EGGAAARQTRDDQGPPDLLARDPRMPRSIAFQHQAVHEHAGQIFARRDAAHEVQAGLGLEGPEEPLEWLPEGGIAEVVEAGPAAGRGEHAVRVQAEESPSRTGHDAGAVAHGIEPGPLPGRPAMHRRSHQRWTRKTPTPIKSEPAHWTGL